MIQDYLDSLPLKERNSEIALINTQITEGSYNPLTIPKKVIFQRARSSYFNGLQLSLTMGVALGFGVVAVTNPVVGLGAAAIATIGGMKLSFDKWQDSQQALDENDFGYLLDESEVLELQKCLKEMPEPKNPRIRRAVKVAQAIVDEELEELGLGEYENEIEADFEEVEDIEGDGEPEGVDDDSQGTEGDNDTELFDSASIPMEDDPNYRGVDNPWDPSEKLSPFDQAMVWCAEKEHTDRVECQAVGLDYDQYMQAVARAVMDGGPAPSPAEVQTRLDIQQPAESVGYKQALAEGESFMQSLARHPSTPQHDTPASPSDDPLVTPMCKADRNDDETTLSTFRRNPFGDVSRNLSEEVSGVEETEKIVLEFAPYELDINNKDTTDAISMSREIGKSQSWIMKNLFQGVSPGDNANYRTFKQIIEYSDFL